MKKSKKNKKEVKFGTIILAAFLIKGGAIAIEHATTNHTKEVCPITIMALNNGLESLAENHQSNGVKKECSKQGKIAFAKLEDNGFTLIEQKEPYWYESFDFLEIPTTKSR